MPRTLEELREIEEAAQLSLKHKGWEDVKGVPAIHCDVCELDTPHARVTSTPIDDKGTHIFQCLCCDRRIEAIYEKAGTGIAFRVVKTETRKIIGFDIEIVKEVPEGEELMDHMPLGISCMAAHRVGFGDTDAAWHTRREVDGMFGGAMGPGALDEVVYWLHEMQQDKGYKIITWNGAGFDFQVLASECFCGDLVREIVWDHIDLGFQMLCEKGYMIGLDTAANGLGLVGKLEGMKGALAPVMWKQDRAAQDKVLEYVEQDARLTGQVYEALLKKGTLHWITKKGQHSKYPWVPKFRGNIREKGRFLTVRECLEIPKPNTSWMDNPMTRGKCVDWLEE